MNYDTEIIPLAVICSVTVIILVIIYVVYKIESKNLNLIERGLLRHETNRRKKLVLLNAFILTSTGAAILVGSFISDDPIICSKITAGLIPLFIGVTLFLYYCMAKKIEASKESRPA
jgi:Na+/H+ antiporter NhaD/arsenite permease-like protein